MTAPRSFVAAVLSILLGASAPARALSLYSGPRAQLPRTVAPIEAAPAVFEGLLPAPLPPALPAALGANPAPEAVEGAAPRAAAQAAAPASAGADDNAAANGAKGGAPPRAAEAELFAAGHVHAAIAEYFGALADGEAPGVVVSRRARLEAAPTDGELLESVRESKKTAAEREAAAIRLFVLGGAKYDPAHALVETPDFSRYDEVQLQEVRDGRGRPTGKHNIFVLKRGRTDRILVSSSHNDKVSEGDGVIDNWTGTTLVTHLYRTEKDLETEAARIYVSFAREEDGLLGSQHFLASLSPAQRARIEADINYDTIAIKGGATNSWENNSDGVLLDAADAAVADANARLADGDRLSLSRDYLDGGDADSSSFRWQRPPIPAMTIYSGPEDLVFSIIHTARDNFGAFDFGLYKNTYRVAAALLRWLDAHPLSGRAGA